MTTSTTNNSTRVQLMNENPTNAYYMLVTTSELNTTFQDLYCFFMNVAANRGEVYTSKLNEESTRMALLQMNNAGAFDTWASKDIYVASFNRKLYKELRSQLNEADCYHYIEAIDIVIEEQEKYTSRSYNVRSASTCMLTNEASTWEFMQRLDFIEELKQYKKQYMRATKRNSESV